MAARRTGWTSCRKSNPISRKATRRRKPWAPRNSRTCSRTPMEMAEARLRSLQIVSLRTRLSPRMWAFMKTYLFRSKRPAKPERMPRRVWQVLLPERMEIQFWWMPTVMNLPRLLRKVWWVLFFFIRSIMCTWPMNEWATTSKIQPLMVRTTTLRWNITGMKPLVIMACR